VSGYARAALVDMVERNIDQLSAINGRIAMPMRACGLATVKLLPGSHPGHVSSGRES